MQTLRREKWRSYASSLRSMLKLRSTVEMATAQRTRPRAVVGAPRRAAWQPKSILRHSISVAPRTIIFYIFLQLLQVNYFMSNNGRS